MVKWLALLAALFIAGCDAPGPHGSGNGTGTYPADPGMGIGPRWVILSTNGGNTVYDKNLQGFPAQGPFYANAIQPFAAQGGYCFGDARYEQDVWSGRTYAVSQVAGLYLCLARSEPHNPFQWTSWLIEGPFGQTNVDFPTLTIAEDTIQVATRIPGSYTWVFNRHEVDAGRLVSFVRQNSLYENVAVRFPWHQNINNGTTTYSISPGSNNSGLRIYRYRGVPPNVNVSSVLVNTGNFGHTINPRQPNGPSVDDRQNIYDAVMNGPNEIEVLVPDMRNGRPTTKLIRITGIQNDFAQAHAYSHTWLTAGTADTWNGSIDIGFLAARPHHVAVNCGGPNQYAGICAGYLDEGQRPEVKNLQVIKPGTATYGIGNPSPVRWGDFLTLRMDPYVAPNWVWTFGQVARNSNNSLTDWHTNAMQYTAGCNAGIGDIWRPGGDPGRNCPQPVNIDQVALAAYGQGATAAALDAALNDDDFDDGADDVTDTEVFTAEAASVPGALPAGITVP